MSKADRGFASMDPEKHKQIASKGGKAAHATGKAHRWDADAARIAGQKGGLALKRRRHQERTSSR